MTITTEQVQLLAQGGGKVFAAGDDKVGSIGQIYLDDTTGTPTWVTVKTGLFGTAESFVPLEGARVDGDDIYVNFAEDKIKDAPRVDADGAITPQEEDQLYRYYGLGGGGDTAGRYDDQDRATTGTATAGTTEGDQTGRAGQAAGRDTSGPSTDDAMTRSEERVEVGTATREAGKARLRKYVTTEEVTKTVPVRHEEVTIDREPITDANAAAAGAGPSISEEEHEVTLHEEVPVVDKEVVAQERVSLGKETVTDETTVSEEVRKENIELVDDNGQGGKSKKR